MSDHPLDISGILKSRPDSENGQDQSSNDERGPHSPDTQEACRIEGQYWNQLNQESRRMLTSRIWKGVDFNPMLRELDDLSRITEKWLKWAVPTYVNGVKEGPIKDWIEGVNREKDFHYVLVGEHLRHLKELREKRKEEQATSNTTVGNEERANPQDSNETSAQTLNSNVDESSQDLNASIETLDGHIRWFKQYLKERET